jgi:hypothetical protein
MALPITRPEANLRQGVHGVEMAALDVSEIRNSSVRAEKLIMRLYASSTRARKKPRFRGFCRAL